MKKNLILFILLITSGLLKAQHDTMIMAPGNGPNDNRVYTFVQVPPKFNGDAKKFLEDHIQYPPSALKNNQEGVVYVAFIIEKDGSVSNVKVLRGISPDLNKEALREISAMPAWSPGYQSGNAVRVQYTLPVRFSIKDAQRPSDTLSAKDTTVTYEPDFKPKFNGDYDGYIKTNLVYPKSAVDRKIEGTVYITFVVSKTGKVKSPMVLRGVDSALDRAALTLVTNMPDWIPGTIQNNPVNVQLTLPVHFALTTKTVDVPGEYIPAAPVSAPTQTQTPPNTEQWEYRCRDTRDGIWIEPHFGLGLSKIYMNNSDVITSSSSSAFGFSAGCDIGIMIGDNSGFVTGLQIQQFGSHYASTLMYGFPEGAPPPIATSGSATDSSTASDHSASVNYTFTYLQIPLMYRYVSSDACNLGFHFEGGLLVGYLIGASESGSITESINQWTKQGFGIAEFYTYAGNSTVVQSANTSPDASKIDLELVCKFGLLTPLSSSMSLAVDFVPEFKLNNAGDGLKDVVNFGNNSYSYYGSGNYGGGLAFLVEVKLLFCHN